MLTIPAQTTAEHWKQLTDDNAHNRARIEICSWLLRQLHTDHAQRTEAEHALMQLHKVFSAIETIAEDIGHMTGDLIEIRHTKTDLMISLVRRLNPEVAKIIYNSL